MSVDERFMQLAVEAARQGEGLTRPNPPVGAVLVREEVVLATGWHAVAGGDHAERACLNAVAGEDLSGSTLYITLEPCSTYGRTPPCSAFILEHQLQRVVVGTLDPNPVHAGRGIEQLKESGVEVSVGVCEEDARCLIEPFVSWMVRRRPFVTLKLAVTLDGRMADAAGSSKWISGGAAREWVQGLRRKVDAVMVGAETVRRDDPSLLPRPAEGRSPWRIIMGEDIPDEACVVSDEAADRTLIRTGELGPVLASLAADYDVMHLLCEGGGGVAAQLLEANLVDELVMIVAPKILGADGRPCFNFVGRSMESLFKGRLVDSERLGEDMVMRIRFGE